MTMPISGRAAMLIAIQPGFLLQEPGERRGRGRRRVDDEIVARLDPGALRGPIGPRQQRRAADVGEVPAEPDERVGDHEVREVDAGELTTAQPTWISAPVAMMVRTPNFWIRCPVKNDGRNIAMMCTWITVALSAN